MAHGRTAKKNVASLYQPIFFKQIAITHQLGNPSFSSFPLDKSFSAHVQGTSNVMLKKWSILALKSFNSPSRMFDRIQNEQKTPGFSSSHAKIPHLLQALLQTGEFMRG